MKRPKCWVKLLRHSPRHSHHGPAGSERVDGQDELIEVSSSRTRQHGPFSNIDFDDRIRSAGAVVLRRRTAVERDHGNAIDLAGLFQTGSVAKANRVIDALARTNRHHSATSGTRDLKPETAGRDRKSTRLNSSH